MNMRRLLLAASCRDGARGRMARRASAEGEFVQALDETDRLLRIDPRHPGDPAAGDDRAARVARQRVVQALDSVQPAPAARWRPAAGTALAAAAAAAIVVTPLVVWRSAGGPAGGAAPAEQAIAAAPQLPRLSWTMVVEFDQPLRAEAAALAADVRQFGWLVAPGVMPAAEDEGG